MVDDDAEAAAPSYGPSGYLPERASRRARKIVLRAPLGLQWVVGALLVGVGLLAAVVLFTQRDTTPGPPFVAVAADVAALPPAATTPTAGGTVLLVAVGGPPRAFVVPDEGAVPRWCEASGLLEADAGRAWRATGRGVRDTPSLRPLPTLVADGTVFVDPTAEQPPARPEEAGPASAC